jgi:CBS domain containing-hemolysin-like protein
MKPEPRPSLTVGQALVIAALLAVGLLILPDRWALILLLGLMGVVAWLLNRLFQWILRLVAEEPHDE